MLSNIALPTAEELAAGRLDHFYSQILSQKLILSVEQLQQLEFQQEAAKAPFFKILLKNQYPKPQDEQVQQWALRLAELELMMKTHLITPEQAVLIADEAPVKEDVLLFLQEKNWVNASTAKAYIQKLCQQNYDKFSNRNLAAPFLALLPPRISVRYQALPIFKLGSHLIVALVHPDNLVVADDIAQITRCKVYPTIISQTTFERLLKELIFSRQELIALEKDTLVPDEIPQGVTGGNEAGRADPISTHDASKKTPSEAQKNNLQSDLVSASQHFSASQLVDQIFGLAVAQDVSDIHIEAGQHETLIRFRKDGFLTQILSLPAERHEQVVARIKILAALDIGEKRLPQDGRLRFEDQGRSMDMRVASALSRYGETLVMRLIDRAKAVIPLEQLGVPENELRQLQKMLSNTKGLVLVTGPTGSGKTTTLYASLNQLTNPNLKVISVEDPVEYDLAGVVQLPVISKIDLTYARLLRSILRQDPDIVMIGEIRDAETAKIACEAALTGHLVLSSLHTNDTIATVTRLTDMGIEPFMISSVLVGVIAQRLLRKICFKCRQPFQPLPELLEQLHLGHLVQSQPTFYEAAGCRACNYKGYQGRLGVYEVLTFNDALRDSILKGEPEHVLREKAIKGCGLRPLRDQAIDLLKKGLTTLDVVGPLMLDFGDSPLIHCPNCHEQISRDYPKCPYCTYVLKMSCPQCKTMVKDDWTVCAECGFILKSEALFTTFKMPGAG